MDIFKDLPFDLQETIYKNVIYKKNHDNFIKNFDSMVKHILCYFRYLLNYTDLHSDRHNYLKDELFFKSKDFIKYIKQYEKKKNKQEYLMIDD
jgi:hypothetical protein